MEFVFVALPTIADHTEDITTHSLSVTHRSAKLFCLARSFPASPDIVWEPADIARMSTVISLPYTGKDGANYLSSAIIARRDGNYSCLLRETKERKTFAVIGNTPQIVA